jgi:hypothetical protein
MLPLITDPLSLFVRRPRATESLLLSMIGAHPASIGGAAKNTDASGSSKLS